MKLLKSGLSKISSTSKVFEVITPGRRVKNFKKNKLNFVDENKGLF